MERYYKYVSIVEWSLLKDSNLFYFIFSEIMVEDNVDVRARLEKKALPIVQYIEIEHPTQGYSEYTPLANPGVFDGGGGGHKGICHEF